MADEIERPNAIVRLNENNPGFQDSGGGGSRTGGGLVLINKYKSENVC